jgi:hypothetical protein
LFEVLGNHPLIVRSIPRYFNKHNWNRNLKIMLFIKMINKMLISRKK